MAHKSISRAWKLAQIDDEVKNELVREKDAKAMQTDHWNHFFMLLKTQCEAENHFHWLNFFHVCYYLEILVNFRCLSVMTYVFFCYHYYEIAVC
jgi:hypothetical protein